MALRQLKAKVRYRTTALASFTSYAISFTLGFPLITGGTVRYWLYSRAGLRASAVASLTIIAGVTFWLGMGLIIGLGLLFRAAAISRLDHLAPWINMALGRRHARRTRGLSHLGISSAAASAASKASAWNSRVFA